MPEMSLTTLKDTMPAPGERLSLASMGRGGKLLPEYLLPPSSDPLGGADRVDLLKRGLLALVPDYLKPQSHLPMSSDQPGKVQFQAGGYPEVGAILPQLLVDVAGLVPAAGAKLGAMTAMAMIPGRRGVKRTTSLPMDAAARAARAEDLGFRLDQPLAHGTASDFRAFDLGKGGSATGAAPARLGVWTEMTRPAEEAAIAGRFADIAAKKTATDPRLMPLVYRTKKQGVISLSGNELDQSIAATLADAWDDGFDSIMLRNHTRHGGRPGTALVVKDPAQLRSPFAAFDPKKVKSRDLLAGVALGSVGAPLALNPEAKE